MHGSGAGAGWIEPRHRAAEGPIHFEHSRTVFESRETANVRCREPRPGNAHQLARGEVEQVGARVRQLLHRGDTLTYAELAAVRLYFFDQRPRDGFRAS